MEAAALIAASRLRRYKGSELLGMKASMPHNGNVTFPVHDARGFKKRCNINSQISLSNPEMLILLDTEISRKNPKV